MAKSKAYRAAAALLEEGKLYTPAEAVAVARQTGSKKFDSTVEVALKLGVDPRKADQMVRGTVMLPHGTGKTARVIVFATGPAAEAAIAAGADDVRTGGLGLGGLVADGEHDDPGGLTGPVGQVHGPADHLVRLAGVDTQPHGDLDGRVHLAARGLLGQLGGLERGVQGVLVDLGRGLLVDLAALRHLQSFVKSVVGAALRLSHAFRGSVS